MSLKSYNQDNDSFTWGSFLKLFYQVCVEQVLPFGIPLSCCTVDLTQNTEYLESVIDPLVFMDWTYCFTVDISASQTPMV